MEKLRRREREREIERERKREMLCRKGQKLKAREEVCLQVLLALSMGTA